MKILLSETKLFRGIDEADIPAVLERLGAVRKTFKKGEYVFREGDTTDSLGLVLTGAVVMEYSDAWGQNSLIGSARPGEVFAESYAAIPDEKLMISVRAAEDSEVLFIRVERTLSCGCGTVLVRNLLTVSAGRSFAKAAARKTASAAVSSRAPKTLAEPILRATGPSAMSVRPQKRYKAQKPEENAGRASNPRLPKIRQAVSKFAACLRRSI